jgi:hypothetical protein
LTREGFGHDEISEAIWNPPHDHGLRPRSAARSLGATFSNLPTASAPRAGAFSFRYCNGSRAGSSLSPISIS